MQAVSSGLVRSVVAGIAPVLMGEMPAPGAALRAEGLSSRRQFAPRPVHHQQAGSAPWRKSARRGCSARRADRRMTGALAQSGQVPECRGRQATDGTAG